MHAVHLHCAIHTGLPVLCCPCHAVCVVLSDPCQCLPCCAICTALSVLCHAGYAMPSLLCWLRPSYQEKVLELARPQLALVPLGYSMSLLLWDLHGPGTQLPFQSIVWQVRAQDMARER